MVRGNKALSVTVNEIFNGECDAMVHVNDPQTKVKVRIDVYRSPQIFTITSVSGSTRGLRV